MNFLVHFYHRLSEIHFFIDLSSIIPFGLEMKYHTLPTTFSTFSTIYYRLLETNSTIKDYRDNSIRNDFPYNRAVLCPTHESRSTLHALLDIFHCELTNRLFWRPSSNQTKIKLQHAARHALHNITPHPTPYNRLEQSPAEQTYLHATPNYTAY